MDAEFTGKQIAEHRKAKGLTQKALAESLYVTDKAVSKWERGVNFPDLGILDALAQELDTSVATLLGLENAPQEDAIDSMVQLFTEQAEETKRDICRIGWIAVLLAVLLMTISVLYGRNVRHTQYAYYLLYTCAFLTAHGGWFILRKYGQLRELEPFDLIPLSMLLFPLFIVFLIQWMTGSNPSALFFYGLIFLGSTGLQWYFYRILVPYWGKTLPLILTLGYALWHFYSGRFVVEFMLPAIACGITFLVLFLKERKFM